MSKTISSIDFDIDQQLIDTTWTRISQADNTIVPLLLRLDAPNRHLSFWGEEEFDRTVLSNYMEMLARYSNFSKGFESITLDFLPELSTFVIRLVEDMASAGRLRSFVACTDEPADLPVSFWNSFFLSNSFESVTADLLSIDVVLRVVAQWKQMDPHTLVPSKVVRIITAPPNTLVNAGMTPVPMESVETKVLKKIERNIGCSRITSLFCIDHPADPSRTIYIVRTVHVVFEKRSCFLFFD
uniref:Cilia- and flagella-associated protein 300 n=2 Tax=Steinernema glaseri TaxID=37863 RepID=A0A1I7XWY1_9BILA